MTYDEAQVVFDTTQIGMYALAGLFIAMGLLLLIGEIILVIQKHRWKKKNKPLMGQVEDPEVGLVNFREDLSKNAEECRATLREYEAMIADIDTELDEIRTENLMFGWREKK